MSTLKKPIPSFIVMGPDPGWHTLYYPDGRVFMRDIVTGKLKGLMALPDDDDLNNAKVTDPRR